MFGRSWETAEATVIASHYLKSHNTDGISAREFVVDVTTPGGEVFRAKVGEPRIATNFWPPRVGQRVGVEYDPRSRDVRFDKDDPQLSARAQRKAQEAATQRAFDATLEGPAGGRAVLPQATLLGGLNWPAADGGAFASPAGLDPNQLAAALAAAGQPAVVRLDGQPGAADLQATLLAAIAAAQASAQASAR